MLYEVITKTLQGRIGSPQVDFENRTAPVFPAEVTFSRFETRNGAYKTLILRNSDERLRNNFV